MAAKGQVFQAVPFYRKPAVFSRPLLSVPFEEKMNIDARSVFVGNVDYETTEQELEQHFRSCGSINRVTIPRNKWTGSRKGFAYIEFSEKKALLAAIALDNTEFRGRQIKVTLKRTNIPGISTTNRLPRGFNSKTVKSSTVFFTNENESSAEAQDLEAVFIDDDESHELESEETYKELSVTAVHLEEVATVKFDPPVCRSRYEFASKLIEEAKCFRVADFGCGSLRLLTDFLCHSKILQLYRGIDLCLDELTKGITFVNQRVLEDLGQREVPLIVEALHGDILAAEADKVEDSRLLNFDCITMIEVIEHVNRPDADRLLGYVLGRLKPPLAIVTTPNADFNVLFQEGSDRPISRHADNKFELTRSDFKSLVANAAELYGYTVDIEGIGRPVNWFGFDEEKIGCCTQAAVFKRNIKTDDFTAATTETKSADGSEICRTPHFQLAASSVFQRTTLSKPTAAS